MALPSIRCFSLAATLGLLAACAQVADRTVATPARNVIQPTLAERLGDPALAERVTTCVIANASPGELTRIAADGTSIVGPAPNIVQLIADILARPQTTACARAAA